MDIKKIILFLSTFLSITQTTLEASFLHQCTTWWQKPIEKPNIGQQLRLAAKHFRIATAIETTLRSMSTAIFQVNIDSFHQHKDRLLDLIKKNPDILWHKHQWNGPQTMYLIDAVDFSTQPVNRTLAHTVPQAQYTAFLQATKDTYAACLRLNKRTILGSSPEHSYLKQLIEEDQKADRPTIKLELALDHLIKVRQGNSSLTLLSEKLPKDLNNLIAEYVCGIPPYNIKKCKEEPKNVAARRQSTEKNEFDFFYDHFLKKAANGDASSETIHYQGLIKRFIYSGLTKNKLFKKTTASIQSIHSADCASSRLLALVASSIALVYCLLVVAVCSSSTWQYELITMALTPIPALLMTYSFDKFKSARETACKHSIRMQQFMGKWKRFAQVINNTRLPFEEGINNIPNVIPISAREENDLELE